MEEFILGQRWVSNAELSLGLGILIEVEHRIVTINFIASGETRTYAKENAPLTRIIYDIGEQINAIDGLYFEVMDRTEVDGLIIYHGKDTEGLPISLEEGQLNHFVQLNRPAERLFIGQIDKNYWFNLRYQTLQKNRVLNHSPLAGLTGCRTTLIAHQLFIAHEVATRYAPRVLLADEVGLGKTIEAGLILHHQLLHERVQRVLIVVPESLIHQWLVEMLRRFNLMFSIFDQQRCQVNNEEEEVNNPFLEAQLVLCSLEFLAENQQDYQNALGGEWDLLVVDEAHHLQWSEEKSSHEYDLIEQLTHKTKGVLLLTATPEQLGIESHFARLRLLDPDRFPDLKAFIAEEQSYQPIAQAIDVLMSGKKLDQKTNDLLKPFLSELSQHTLPEQDTISDRDRTLLIEQLLDRHGTGRVLFRNTRNTIKGFPRRTVMAHPQPLPEAYQDILQKFCDPFLQAIELEEEDAFSNLILFPELLYQIEAEQLQSPLDWTQVDPRVEWLSDWLLEQRHIDQEAKILVIVANASSVIDLSNTLKRQYGIVAAIFHEGLSLIERDRAAAFFADTENGSSVLICSEIGSEGRNFQFAHQMVLFDLPLNPDLLEQRIGRLDRIGQTHTIHIHIPYLQNTAQERLFHWYHSGLNAFEQTCPVGNNVFTQMQALLQTVLLTAQSDKRALLIEQTQALSHTLNDALHKGRDRLLEYNSCRQPEADQLKALADKESTNHDLRHYMETVFDVFGIDHSDHSEGCYIITPTEQMVDAFSGLPDDGMTISYNRTIALANEDIQFFTWDHPMVRSSMDRVSSGEMGNTAMTTLESDGLEIRIAPGSLLLECLFILETSAHQDLQADRYLPSSSIRVLMNEQGQDLSQYIKPSDIGIIDAKKKGIKNKIARQIIKVKEEALRDMIKQAEQQCQQQTPQLLSVARKASQQTLMKEMNRLKALAKVNPNIRTEEIDFYGQQLDSLETIFDTITPRLDALRVIIVT